MPTLRATCPRMSVAAAERTFSQFGGFAQYQKGS